MNKNLFKIQNSKFKILLLVLLLIGLLPLPAKARTGAISPTIGVAPAKIFESVTPGKTSEFQIKLRNLGVDAIPLQATTSEIGGISESGAPVFSQTPSARSATGWIKIINKEVIVDSGKTEPVTIKVAVPASTAPGGYIAAVHFQAQLPSYYFDLDASTRILPAISVPIFLTVPAENRPTVDDLTLENLQVPRIVTGVPLSVVARVKNPSNFFIQADAKASIKNALTSKTVSDDLGTLILLPDGTRKVVGAFEQNLWPGIYQASVEFKQGDRVLVSAAKFVALPWPFIVILIALSILALGFASRRRFRRAWAVLRGQEARRSRRPTIR